MFSMRFLAYDVVKQGQLKRPSRSFNLSIQIDAQIYANIITDNVEVTRVISSIVHDMKKV